jgi:hypothetical protein
MKLSGVWLRKRRHTSQFCDESNDFGTLQKGDFWTTRTDMNRLKT